ncbi:MAG TPA: RloB family protein [Bacteroidales bacterium]|nr:RloB family protein [Bacteroidales bacterium]
MAKKVKIPNHIKKRYERVESKRLENVKSKRRFYLIVCEGEKTEPNYFESLKNDLPKGVLNVCDFRIEGTGNNTVSLVKRAMALRDQWQMQIEKPIDKLWIVFDKDSFSDQSFNAAIQTCMAKNPVVDCAWTNEAFELWYLLHFHYYNTGISRKQYQELIEKNFKEKGLKNYTYKKNSTEMYSLLKTYANRDFAIKNAVKLKKLYLGQQNYSTHNPCTMVYKLVAELFGLEEIIEEDKNKF